MVFDIRHCNSNLNPFFRLKEQQLLAELGPEASHELSGDIRELVRKQINFITKEDEAMNQQQDKENQKQGRELGTAFKR